MSNFQKYTNQTIKVSADSETLGLLNTKLFDSTSTSKQVFFVYKQMMEILLEHQAIIVFHQILITLTVVELYQIVHQEKIQQQLEVYI